MFQIHTSVKSPFPYFANSFRDSNFLHAMTISKSFLPNGLHTGRNSRSRTCNNKFVKFCIYDGIATVSRIYEIIIRIYHNGFKVPTTDKHMTSITRRSRKLHRFKIDASTKSIVTKRRHSFIYYQMTYFRTTGKPIRCHALYLVSLPLVLYRSWNVKFLLHRFL